MPDREQLKHLWESDRFSKQLRAFAKMLINNPSEDLDAITHLVSISDDKKQGFEDYMALRESEIQSPFHNPYFRVRGDAELMLVRLLIPKMRAWDFKTGKKVIK